ncbi:DUF3499 domain-containing protein [Georgenia sp. Z1491]|uniref:DUF3499 domain-containing protein n=1 Tax=Georgenia sp. Z1491 TaxID=3416707 RepID=UPI003CF582E8
MRAVRQCTKPSCTRSAAATLTYVYADSTAVLGPLSATPEPHAYDLCDVHAGRLSVPRGWDVVRLSTSFEAAPPSSDDIEALADAVRAAARRGPREHRPAERAVAVRRGTPAPVTGEPPAREHEITRRGHLRLLRGGDDTTTDESEPR